MLKTALAWSVVDDEMSKAQSPLPSKRNYQDAGFSSSEIPLVFYYLPSFSVYTGALMYDQHRDRPKIEHTRGLNLHPCISQ